LLATPKYTITKERAVCLSFSRHFAAGVFSGEHK
jgi:hypothetical protein